MGRSPRNRVLSIVMLVVAAFALTGCFKVNMNLTVNADDTVDGSFIFALDKQLAAMAGDQTMQDMGTSEQDLQSLGAKTSVKPYSDDKFVGQEIDFTGAPLAGMSQSFSEGGDTFSLTHTDGKYVFDATMDMSQALSSGGPSDVPTDLFSDQMMQQMMEGAEFKISITFPGKVTDSNGTIDGSTVTWNLDLTSTNSLHAEAEEGGAVAKASAKVEDAVGIPLWAVILILVAVLALLGVGGFFWQRNRKPSTPAPPIPEGATVPPAPTGSTPPPGAAPEASPTTPDDTAPTQVLGEPDDGPTDGNDGTPPDEPTTRL